MPLEDEFIPLEEELIPPEDDEECMLPEELAPMLLPVDLFWPGGEVWPTVPDGEVAGVAEFDGVVVKSLPFLPPEEAPDGV